MNRPTHLAAQYLSTASAEVAPAPLAYARRLSRPSACRRLSSRPTSSRPASAAARVRIPAFAHVGVYSYARLRRCAFALTLAAARCSRVVGSGREARS